MSAPGRLVVVLPLTPLLVGDRFAVERWPLHITVVPPFFADVGIEVVAAAIERGAAGCGPLTVEVGDDALFGREASIPVSLIREHPPLQELRRELVECVRPFVAGNDDARTDIGRFAAHITMKQHGRAHRGDRHRLTQVALVDMVPRASPNGRTVLAVAALGSDV